MKQRVPQETVYKSQFNESVVIFFIRNDGIYVLLLYITTLYLSVNFISIWGLLTIKRVEL